MLTAARTGTNSEEDMGISAAMLSFVLLVLETTAGEGASAATAATSQRPRWEQKCISRNVTDIHKPEKTRFDHNGFEYPKEEMCNEILFVSRSEWGARPPKAVNYINSPGGVSYVFFHNTEESECFCKDSCAQNISLWQRVHQDCQDWDDIGYNFLIGSNGMVFEGRGWGQIGAHTVGFNNMSLSFGFVGNYSRKVPDGRMLKAADNLIQCGIQLKKIRANYTLHGQVDANCRESPGKAFHDLMKTMPHFGGKLPNWICTPDPWD